MRPFLCQFLIVAVLYMSIHGAMDIASQGHPHEDQSAQTVDAELTVSKTEPPHTDPLSGGEHSEHCCHGHAASIVMQLAPTNVPVAANGEPALQPAHVSEAVQAPPTPPPNA